MKNCKWFDIKAAKRRSLNAHNRAVRGWKKRHAECDRIARLDPIQVGGKIKERLIRIVDEERVIERTFFEFDRLCDWKRKRREVLRIIAAILCLTLSGCESFIRYVNNEKRPNPYKPQIHQASEYK